MPDPLTPLDRLDRPGHPNLQRSESLRAELAALSAMLQPVDPEVPPDVGAGPTSGARAPVSAASDTLLPTLQAALGAAYTLERELGGGGMSRVFVATETALARRVAVKVLTPELAQGLSADRFTREITLAAALQDPHIVPVLTAGVTQSGLPFFTMPFVPGESLRARLARGPVPLDEAVRILRDMAEALEYAHEHGVVHRDIKPENVLLSGRNAVVADFGIAKALSAAQGNSLGMTLTSVGMSLGTPAYMSPEQAAGDAVDHRADLYAWGVVAFELLAGAHPFAHKTTTQQLIMAQISEAPVALDSRAPAAPAALTAVVMRCLAKAANERPASATALLAVLADVRTATSVSGSHTSIHRESLTTQAGRTASRTAIAQRTRWLGAGAVVLLLALSGAWIARQRAANTATASASTVPSLAVLPFEHQGDSASAYLTDGITDEIRGKLSAVRDLVVIARASSQQYRATKKSPQEIAEELGVRWLLTGTVRVVGTGTSQHVIVSPELVEITAQGQPQSRWSQPFDVQGNDVLRLQGEVAGQVVSAMQVAVTGDDRARVTAVPTRDPVAYDLYLRARGATNYGANSDPASLARALALLEQTVARDSAFAPAWAALASSAATLYYNDRPTPALARRSREASSRSVALAPASPDGYLARAAYSRLIERDPNGALAELQKARQFGPTDERVSRQIAVVQADLGRFDEALREYHNAIARDPRASLGYANRGRLLVRLRRHAEARTSLDRALALAPTSLNSINTRMLVEVAVGDSVAARRIIREAAREVPVERLLAYIGTYYDMGWVLTDDDQQHLLTVGAAAYNGDSVTMAGVRAQVHDWRGETALARRTAMVAARGLETQLRDAPGDAQRHVILGLQHAIAGDSAAALTAVTRGLMLADAKASAHMSASNAYYYYVAARAAARAGNHVRAVQWLGESLLRKYFATPAWIRLDPSFASLRGDPAFEKVLAEAK